MSDDEGRSDGSDEMGETESGSGADSLGGVADSRPWWKKPVTLGFLAIGGVAIVVLGIVVLTSGDDETPAIDDSPLIGLGPSADSAPFLTLPGVLADLGLLTPPFEVDTNGEGQIRSGRNELAQDPHLNSQSLLADVILTADDIAALPNVVGNPMPGRHTVLVDQRSGPPTAGVNYQEAILFLADPSILPVPDGDHISPADRLGDITKRVFLTPAAQRIDAFDESFDPIDTNVFFVADGDVRAVFIPLQEAANDPGIVFRRELFGRDGNVAESPAGYRVSGVLPFGAVDVPGRFGALSDDGSIGQGGGDGTFWFYAAEDHEALLKVIDGCDFNEHFWVFAAAATDVEYTLTVTDTETGDSRTYGDLLGGPAEAILDTEAFATCP